MPTTSSAGDGAASVADIGVLLDRWDTATERLRQTHESLQAEISRLSNELEAKNRQLARQARLADLGKAAAHIAHEVRNGLMPLKLYLSQLRRRTEHDAENRRYADHIGAGFTALEATVNDLLQFASDRRPRMTTLSLLELLQEVCDAVAPQLAAQRIRVEIDAANVGAVQADHGMIRRGVMNLVLNAVDAMPDGGELVITACRVAGGVEIEVADSGPGIDPDVGERVFEPFYTTKGGGAGLGLAIVQRIAQIHGGQLNALNCPEGGAAFTIHLPNKALEAAA